MKRTVLLSVVVALLLVLQVGSAGAQDPQTLTGEYEWSQRGNRGDLEAVFTATGEGKWDVAFHFSFRGEAHVYTGTAKGSLSEGELSGKVLNEGKNRTFTFSGTFEDGTFRGTHAELEDGRPYDTGTLTLE